MTKEESAARIGPVVDKMIARCDEIAACAQDDGCKVCNLFLPRENRKTVQLCLVFVAAVATSSSMSAIAVLHPALAALAEHAQAANDAVASALPKNCRSLITCVSSGEQFVLNLLLRGDSTALRLAKLARPLSVPLRQLFLLCSQKLHEQLTVGC